MNTNVTTTLCTDAAALAKLIHKVASKGVGNTSYAGDVVAQAYLLSTKQAAGMEPDWSWDFRVTNTEARNKLPGGATLQIRFVAVWDERTHATREAMVRCLKKAAGDGTIIVTYEV